MKLSFTNERVLAVMAHPDDAELLCAGTLARARSDGATIGVCVMCTGDKGQSSKAIENLSSVRHQEAQDAAKTLGAQFFWFGAGDGELFDTYENRRKLIEIYRQFKPTLVIAHAAEDYHPDHRAASALAEAASWFGASRGHVTASPAIDSPPAVWWADTINMSGFEPEIYIDISGQIETKQRMLNAHRSQIQRGNDGDFAPLMELMLAQCRLRGSQSGVGAAEAFRQHRAFKRVRAW